MQSQSGKYYSIDLDQFSYDCIDFPKINFCKHIAAIYEHFPHLCLEEKSLILGPYLPQSSAPIQHDSRLEDILPILIWIQASLSRLSEITYSSAASWAVFDAIQSADYSLDLAIASTGGTSSLLDKDYITPNQKSWPETAKHMGAKARHQKCLPKECRATEQSISLTKGKCLHIHNDPYAGGERSDKCAKPDVLSATANAHACVPTSAPISATPAPPSATVPPSSTAPYAAFKSMPLSQL